MILECPGFQVSLQPLGNLWLTSGASGVKQFEAKKLKGLGSFFAKLATGASPSSQQQQCPWPTTRAARLVIDYAT